MIKITLEINDEIYSAKCDDAEKMKLVKEELKHWQIKKGGE